MYAHVSPTFGAPYASNSNDNLMNNPNQLMRSKSLNDISNDSQLHISLRATADGRPGQVEDTNTHQHISNQNSVANNHNSDYYNDPLCPNLMVSYNNTLQSFAHPSQAQNNLPGCGYEYPIGDFNEQQQQQRNCLTSNNIESIIPHTNMYESSNFRSTTDPYQSVTPFVGGFDNQCSSNNNKSPTSSMMVPTNPASSNSATTAPATTNMFNICNPLSTNLNGVTEQIGNLHL